jgi:ribosomal-protein-alanine N-acetyltransferase
MSKIDRYQDITISFMDVDDLDEVLSIEKASFVKPWSRNIFLRELELKNSRNFVAKIGNQSKSHIAGYITYWIVTDEIHLQKIATGKDYRRIGVSSGLMREMIHESVRNGCRSCILEVGASNESAIKLYEKFGFTVQGVRPLYYSEKTEDALIMGSDMNKFMTRPSYGK